MAASRSGKSEKRTNHSNAGKELRPSLASRIPCSVGDQVQATVQQRWSKFPVLPGARSSEG